MSMTEPTPDAAPSGNVYQRTLALLEEHGWTKGENQDEQGHICLGEALARVVRNTSGPDASSDPSIDYSNALMSLMRRMRTAGIVSGQYPRTPIGWNDEE